MGMKRILAGLALASMITYAQAAEPPERPAQSAALSDADLREFGKMVGNAQTVVYGEDSHGMAQIHAMVPELFRYLVQKKGFRVFVFEVQWGVTEGLGDFMASDRSELGTEENYWLNGAFASKPIAAMLVWIREWNRAHPHDPIQIAGYQPEQPVTDIRETLAFIGKSAPAKLEAGRAALAPCRAGDTETYKSELDFIIANSKINRQGKAAFSDAERQACLAGIKAVETIFDSLPGRASKPASRARLHLFSLSSYFSIQRMVLDTVVTRPDLSPAVQRQMSGDMYGRGDAARLHVYNELKRERFPKAKVFHWMHNWHGFRFASETDGIDGPGGAGIPRGTKSFGELLAAQDGKRVRTFATIVPCGGKCTEPTGSAEPVFTEVLGDKNAFLSAHDPRWIRTLKLDQPAALWANQHRFGFGHVILTHQVDGLFYLPTADPVS